MCLLCGVFVLSFLRLLLVFPMSLWSVSCKSSIFRCTDTWIFSIIVVVNVRAFVSVIVVVVVDAVEVVVFVVVVVEVVAAAAAVVVVVVIVVVTSAEP